MLLTVQPMQDNFPLSDMGQHNNDVEAQDLSPSCPGHHHRDAFQALVQLTSFQRPRVPLPRYPALADVEKLPSFHFLEDFDLDIPERKTNHASVVDGTDLCDHSDATLPCKRTELSYCTKEVDDDDNEENDDYQIELSRQVTKHLRGCFETQAAFDRGECMVATCLLCHIRVACIADCDAVICPVCLSISPIETLAKTDKTSPHLGGVGLGIRLD